MENVNLVNRSGRTLRDPVSQAPQKVSLVARASDDAISVPTTFSVRQTIGHVLQLSGEREPFFVVDLSRVTAQYRRWQRSLPDVRVHYAVKSNPDSRLVAALAALGSSFDCASQKEMEQVLAVTRDPSRIIFTNPCKPIPQLEYAAVVGVERVTADAVYELDKLVRHHPKAKVLIRLKPDDSKSQLRLSSKFGATVSEAAEMLAYARGHDLEVVGVAFHVGSGCTSGQPFVGILADAAEVFRLGTDLGFRMTVLDIGGGFLGVPNAPGESFESMTGTIKAAITGNFATYPDLEVIGEPGQFMSAASSTLVVTIVGKKPCDVDGVAGFKYYIDDGIHGSFNYLLCVPSPVKLEILDPPTGPTHPSVVFGPTCDSTDKIGAFQLPELQMGDRLFFENFGAYTSALTSAFNGFRVSRRFYVSRG